MALMRGTATPKAASPRAASRAADRVAVAALAAAASFGAHPAWGEALPTPPGATAHGLASAMGQGLPVLAAIAFVSALMACCVAGGAALVLARAGLLRTLQASPWTKALADIESAGARLSGVVAQAGTAQGQIAAATEAARAAARGAEAAMGSLAGTQARMCAWLQAAEDGKAKITALADQCGRLTEIMPELLGGAVESMQARGLNELDATQARLNQTAAAIDGAAASLHEGMAALLATATQQTESAHASQQQAEGLTAQIAQLAELPALLQAAMPSGPAAGTAELMDLLTRLDHGVDRIDGAAGALHGGVAALAHTAQHHAALHIKFADLASLQEQLAHDLPGQAAHTLQAIQARGEAVIDRIGAECTDNATGLERAIEAAATRLHREIDTVAATAAARDMAMLHAETLLRTAAQAALAWPEAAAQAGTQAATQHAQALQACLGRAETLAQELSTLAAPLAGAAAAWPPAFAAVPEAAARLAVAGDALVDQAASLVRTQDLAEAAYAGQAARQTGADAIILETHTQLAGRIESALLASQSHVTAAEDMATRLALQTDRIADLLHAGQDTACRLAVSVEAAMAAAAAPQRPAETPQSDPQAQAALAELGARIEQVTAAATLLAARAEAQEKATQGVADAALALVREAAPAAIAPAAIAPAAIKLPPAQPAPAPCLQDTVQAVQTHAACLQIAAAAAARAAAHHQHGALPHGFCAPDMLAAIDVSIRQLQSAATALALASDAVVGRAA
jgi:hypothetical protein